MSFLVISIILSITESKSVSENSITAETDQCAPDKQHVQNIVNTCYNALNVAVTQSIPCLREVLSKWHEVQRKAIGPCQRPRPRPASSPEECIEKGKPTPETSCASCVAWGEALEDAFYPQTLKESMSWDNVNPACLSRSHVMTAKSFMSTLSIQRTRTCTKLEHFDSNNLVLVMMRFKAFHGENMDTYHIIKKVH